MNHLHKFFSQVTFNKVMYTRFNFICRFSRRFFSLLLCNLRADETAGPSTQAHTEQAEQLSEELTSREVKKIAKVKGDYLHHRSLKNIFIQARA